MHTLERRRDEAHWRDTGIARAGASVIEDSIVNPVPFTTVLMGLTMAHKTWMC